MQDTQSGAALAEVQMIKYGLQSNDLKAAATAGSPPNLPLDLIAL